MVVSKVQFSSLLRLFSAVHKHCLPEYSKCRAYQTLLKITHRYKTIIKNWNSINFLSRWRVTLLIFLRKFGACEKLEPAGRIYCFTKSPRLLRWSWILITWDQAQFERFSYILSNGYRFSLSLFVSPCPPECYLQSERKIEPDLRLEYWMNAICLEKLWNNAFCRSLYDSNSAS